FTTNEDELLTVAAPGLLANDTDADGDSLTAVWVSDPQHGTLTLNADGSFSYLPAANWNGEDSFSYQASDGGLLSTVQIVTLTVLPVNDAPVAADDSYMAFEDLSLTMLPAVGVLTNDTDIDGDSLNAVLVSQPAHGTLTWYGYNGTFMYTPDANWNGTDSFTYAASDGTLTSNTVTVTLTVQPVNDAPLAVADAYSLDEDSPLTITTGGVLENDTDVDGDALTAALDSGPLHGNLTLNADGSFSYTPGADWNGSDNFSYHASDGQAASNMVTVTLTVDPVNDAPYLLAALPDQNRPARLPYSFAVSPYFADIDDGDVLTFSAQLADGDPLPAWLSIDAASGVLSGTPDNAAADAYTLRISASDGLETIFDDFVLTVETNQFLLFIPMVKR
ncbi:tandem-95 repeat protein, partial [bacterium]